MTATEMDYVATFKGMDPKEMTIAALHGIFRGGFDRNRFGEVMMAVITCGGDLNVVHDRSTLLNAAVDYNMQDVALALISAGADVHGLSTLGTPILTMAAFNAQKRIIRALVQGGADILAVDAAGESSLDRAMRYIDTEMLKIMLDNSQHLDLDTIHISLNANEEAIDYFNKAKEDRKLRRAFVAAGMPLDKPLKVSSKPLLRKRLPSP